MCLSFGVLPDPEHIAFDRNHAFIWPGEAVFEAHNAFTGADEFN
jgi:hypothetical protein